MRIPRGFLANMFCVQGFMVREALWASCLDPGLLTHQPALHQMILAHPPLMAMKMLRICQMISSPQDLAQYL